MNADTIALVQQLERIADALEAIAITTELTMMRDPNPDRRPPDPLPPFPRPAHRRDT